MPVTSSTVSASLSPLRLATIGAVAALAVAAGAVAGAFLMNGEQAGLGSGLHVPGDAPFYVEVRVVPSDAQDAALRDFLGHFPPIEGIDLGQPLSEQMVEHLDEMLAADGVTLSWSHRHRPMVRRASRVRADLLRRREHDVERVDSPDRGPAGRDRRGRRRGRDRIGSSPRAGRRRRQRRSTRA